MGKQVLPVLIVNPSALGPYHPVTLSPMPSPPSAQPLKVPATPSKHADNDKDKTPIASKAQLPSKSGTIAPNDISSPHELTAFVETLLEQLDHKFDDMSRQILDRMNQMSSRVDALENSIQDIINGDVSVPQSPSPSTPGGMRRSDSGMQ